MNLKSSSMPMAVDQDPLGNAKSSRGMIWLRRPVVLFFVAAGLRVAVLTVLAAHSPVWWGVNEAGNIGRGLVLGRGFASPFHDANGPTAWLAPVYPSLLACIFF